MAELRLNPDRLFPAEPTVRAIARRLYGEVAGLPQRLAERGALCDIDV